MKLFPYKVRFKEKKWMGDDEDGLPDWETTDGWTEKVQAPNLKAALDEAGKKCEAYEKEAAEQGFRIKVSYEIEVSPRALR